MNRAVAHSPNSGASWTNKAMANKRGKAFASRWKEIGERVAFAKRDFP
jgi:hypothetical protein